MRHSFLEEPGAGFDCASDTDRRGQGAQRALSGVASEAFGQETSRVLDVRSSGVAVREEASSLEVSKANPISRSFLLHMRRTGTEPVHKR